MPRLKHILSLLLMLTTFVIWATEATTFSHVMKLSEQATLERYPNADTVLLYSEDYVTYQADGTAVTNSDFYIKPLTEAGRHSLETQSFYFNSSYETLSLEICQVLKPNGESIALDVKQNSRIAISAGQMGANIYDPAHKVMTMTIPNLAIGDIIRFQAIEKEIKPRISGVWCESFPLQSDSPIIEYLIVIDGPANYPLHAVAIKDPVEGTVAFSQETQGDRIRSTWIAKDVPQVIPEPQMPSLHTCVQRLVVSTASNWQEISKWYYNLCRPRLNAITPEMRSKVEELCKNTDSPESKMMAIFQFVSQQIRYMGITAEDEAPGYEPHDVSMTFQQRYGVCRDKAALLVAMLELAGFKAYPVLFMHGPPKDDEVPNNAFNHAVVAVELAPEKYQLMDPTIETTTEFFPASLSNKSYLVARPDGDILRRSPILPATGNLLKIVTNATINPNGTLSGTAQLTFEGINDSIYRSAFSRWSLDYRRQFFAARLKEAIPGATLESLEINPQDVRDMNKPLTAELKFQAKDFIPDTSSEFLLPPPNLSSEFGATSLMMDSFGLEKRHFNLLLFSTCAVEEKFEISTPTSCQIISSPGNLELSVPGVLNCRRNLSTHAGTISGNTWLSFDTVEITPKQYTELKQALQRIDYSRRQFPIAKTNFSIVPAQQEVASFPNANSLLLDHTETITIQDTNNWISVETERRKVLNYAGIKKCSELKFTYNPIWEEISVDATVISPNGQPKKLDKKEINLMDASWVSSAPRYPAEKVLVASLPSVEPGTIIESKVTRKIKNHPFFNTYIPLVGNAPITQSNVTLIAPSRFDCHIGTPDVGVSVSESTDSNLVTRTWSCGSMSQLPREPDQAPAWMYAPTLYFSAGSYSAFAQALDHALREKVQPSPQITALAQELISNPTTNAPNSDPPKPLIRLRDHIARNIRSVGPGLNSLPWSCFTLPEETLSSGYGNSADRAILLATILKVAGIEYKFVLASPLGYAPITLKLMSRFPRNPFNEVLVYVPEYEVYLNDTSEYAWLGTVRNEERIGLELPEGRLLAIRPLGKQGSSVSVSYDVAIKDDGSAQIQVQRRLYGSQFETENRRFSEMTPEQKRIHFEKLISEISQSAVLASQPQIDFTSYPGKVEYTVKVPDFAPITNGYMQLTLPGFSEISDLINTAEPVRNTPLWRNDVTRITLEYRIRPPAGYHAIASHPKRKELENSSSSSFFEYFEPDKTSFRISCGLTLPVELLPALDYDKLSELQRELDKPATSRIILVYSPTPATGQKP